ncbi:histone-lysine N-methyltransferase SETD1B [Neltuma alba]|uniref:histone-lysine N-methyltransferase SETD1B n=1 Tax=Neltuma alba TaxID=207710 RepID=UPI0010A4AB57|nr:histone-lysine N-methyltransferase SETD1B-like [Prosopis alba]
MEVERPHHHNNSTSELFICFTSRLSSSSSMKLSSKSILSPGRSREPSQITLSTSLSRRLRNNGSIKGGTGQASPMFPTTGKKRGCAFENPEPSSPKVTCIGQVRVKTKKQGKKMRARSKKRRGEASFRKAEQGFSDLQNLQQEADLTHRNQRWVHLPLTICEALRSFGAEFSCLFPCRSSSCGREKDEEEKVGKGEGSGEGQSREGSCGAAFARWLVALQEGEVKGREIELVVGEENEKEDDRKEDTPERSRRRHVLEDIEIDVEKKNEEEEDKARVSICIPPKNALLLMRCRSDPVKMAALANRFWESPAPKDEEVEQDDELRREEEEEEEQVHMEEEERDRIEVPAVEEDSSICEREIPEEVETEAQSVIEACESEIPTTPEISEVAEASEGKPEVEEEQAKEVEVEVEEGNGNLKDENLCDNSPEVLADLEKPELEEFHEEKLQEEKDNGEDFCCNELKISESASLSPIISVTSESENNEEEKVEISVPPETSAREEATVESTEKEEQEKETEEGPGEDESTATQVRSDPEDPKPREQKQGQVLPDCLLLMMCEPKLSMEVSKETWVCSTDFVRWLPERPAKRKGGGDEPKKRISIDAKPPLGPPPLMQPPRSSCSFPAPAAHGGGMSMASMIEQKLVGSNAYEPFVLTRCKSEPMRSSTKLAPDACFWKNRKLEPHHRPAALGVGAAGVGF